MDLGTAMTSLPQSAAVLARLKRWEPVPALSARSACAEAMRQHVCSSRPSGENPNPGATAVMMRPPLSRSSWRRSRPSDGQTLSGPQGCQTSALPPVRSTLARNTVSVPGKCPVESRSSLRVPSASPKTSALYRASLSGCVLPPTVSTGLARRPRVTAVPEKHGRGARLDHEAGIAGIGQCDEADSLRFGQPRQDAFRLSARINLADLARRRLAGKLRQGSRRGVEKRLDAARLLQEPEDLRHRKHSKQRKLDPTFGLAAVSGVMSLPVVNPPALLSPDGSSDLK